MTEQTVNSKVVNDILDHTKAYQGHYIQSIYKESLRSLINFFSNLYYQDGDGNNKPIKCYFGSQERSIAALFKENNLVLPVITVTENSSQNSDDRRRYAPVLINEKYWDPKEQRAVRLISLSPRPVDVSYTISIWAEYKEDLDQIREAIFNQFNPSIELEIEKNYNTKIHIESEDDTSRVSVSDKEDRVLRKTINLLSETYIPSPKFLYTSTGKIERFNYEIELVQTPQIFEQAVADQARGTLTIEEIVGRQQIPTTVGGGGTFTGSLATTNLTDVSDLPASATGYVLVWNDTLKIFEPRSLLISEVMGGGNGIVEAPLSETIAQIQEDIDNLNYEIDNLNFDGPYVNTSGDTMTGQLRTPSISSTIYYGPTDSTQLSNSATNATRVLLRTNDARIYAAGNLVFETGPTNTSFYNPKFTISNENNRFVAPAVSATSVSAPTLVTQTIQTNSGSLTLSPFDGAIWFGGVGAAGMRSSTQLTLASNASINWTNVASNFYSASIDTTLQRLNAGSLLLTGASGALTINSTVADVPTVLNISSLTTLNDTVGGKVSFFAGAPQPYAEIQAIQGPSQAYGSLAFITRNAAVNSEKLRILSDGSVSLNGVNPNGGVSHGFLRDNGLVLVGNNSAANSNKTVTYNAIVRTDGFWVNQSLPIGWIEPNAYSTDTTLRRVSPGVISATSSILITSAVSVPIVYTQTIENNIGNTRVAINPSNLQGVWIYGNTRIQAGHLNFNGRTFVEEDAADIVALRNSTTAQALRVYNTYTNDSNYERAAFNWNSNRLEIETEASGTGVGRQLRIGTSGVPRMFFSGTGHRVDIGGDLDGAAGLGEAFVSLNGYGVSNNNIVLRFYSHYGWTDYRIQAGINKNLVFTGRNSTQPENGAGFDFYCRSQAVNGTNGGLGAEGQIRLMGRGTDGAYGGFFRLVAFNDNVNARLGDVNFIFAQDIWGVNSSVSRWYRSGITEFYNTKKIYVDSGFNTSATLLDLSATWNTSATPTAIKLNIVDTSSNAASLLMDLQVGGSSKFSVNKAGMIRTVSNGGLTAPNGSTLEIGSAAGTIYIGGGFNYGSTMMLQNNVCRLTNGTAFGWSNNGFSYGEADTLLSRASSGVISITSSIKALSALIAPTLSGTYITSKTGFIEQDLLIGPNAPVRFWNGAAIRQGPLGTEIQFRSNVPHTAQIAIEANNVLSLRNSTSNQTFRLYNTYTDASNFERAALNWNASAFEIQTEASGTGLARPLILGTSGIPRISISSTGSVLVDLPTNQSLQIGSTSNNHNGIYLWNFGTIRAMFNPYGLRFWDSASIEWGGQGSTAPAGGDTKIYRASPAVVQIASSLQVFSSTISPTISATNYLGLSATQVSSFHPTDDSVESVQEYLDLLNSTVSSLNFDGPYVNVSGDTMTGDLSGTNIYLTGTLAAATKSFLIDHPTKPNKKLQYACLEGPENSVYVRGRTTSTVIELPEYWTGLVHEDSISVNLTAIGHKQPELRVLRIENNKIYLDSDGDVNAFYIVYATRKDVPELEVEF